MELHGFGGELWLGAATTLKLALVSLAAGSFLGAGGCWLQLARPPALRAIGYGYAALVRGVPDLLIIFVVYFGGTQTLNALAGRAVDVSPFLAGMFALALSFGAFASEIFRGAVQAIPRTQREAAHVLGLSRPVAFLTVVAPQAVRAGLPSYGNQAIVLLKQTSLVSVIGCDELMRKAAEASSATRQPFTVYLAVALIYLLFTSAATVLLELAERQAVRRGGV